MNYVDALTSVEWDVCAFLRNTAIRAGIILDSLLRWISNGYIKQSEFQPDGWHAVYLDAPSPIWEEVNTARGNGFTIRKEDNRGTVQGDRVMKQASLWRPTIYRVLACYTYYKSSTSTV